MNLINPQSDNCDHRQCYHDTTKMYSREFHSDHCLHYNLEWFTLILDSIRPSTCVHLKKKIQRKLRTDSFANSYWDRPIFCKFCTVNYRCAQWSKGKRDVSSLGLHVHVQQKVAECIYLSDIWFEVKEYVRTFFRFNIFW